VFVTRKECDVGEQGVGERKECWGRKKGVEPYLGQTWARSRLDRWLALINTQ